MILIDRGEGGTGTNQEDYSLDTNGGDLVQLIAAVTGQVRSL